MTSPSSQSCFVADQPPIKRRCHSLFYDDFTIKSEKLHHLCAKTLTEAEVTVSATNSLISAIYESLDAPLFGESKVCVLDSEFSEHYARDSTGMDSFFDASMVPETAFDEPMDLEGFVPDSKDEGSVDLEGFVPETAFDEPMNLEGFVPDSEDEGSVEADGGDSLILRAEAASVTAAEEAAFEDSPPGEFDEMIGLLLPAYLKLVRSFPDLVCLALIQLCLVSCCGNIAWVSTEMMRLRFLCTYLFEYVNASVSIFVRCICC